VEAATNDKCVHSSRSEYAAVGREPRRRIPQLNLGLHADRAAVLRLCTGVDWSGVINTDFFIGIKQQITQKYLSNKICVRVIL